MHIEHLRRLALSDPSAEATLNRELRRRDLPPEWSVHPSAALGVCESPQRDRVEDWGWDWVGEHLRAAGVSVEGMRLNDAERCDEDGYRLIPGSQLGGGFVRSVIWPDGPYRHYLTAVICDSGERRILCCSGHALDSYPEWQTALTRTRPYAPLTDAWYVAKCKSDPIRSMVALALSDTSRFIPHHMMTGGRHLRR